MAHDARTTGPATYTVEVSGSWLDPRTRIQAPQVKRFNILALHPSAAETAGMQCYADAAAAERCMAVGKRFAKVAR